MKPVRPTFARFSFQQLIRFLVGRNLTFLYGRERLWSAYFGCRRTMFFWFTNLVPLFHGIWSSSFNVGLRINTLAANDMLDLQSNKSDTWIGHSKCVTLKFISKRTMGFRTRTVSNEFWTSGRAAVLWYRAILNTTKRSSETLEWKCTHHSFGGITLTIPACRPYESIDWTKERKSSNSSMVGRKTGMVPPFSWWMVPFRHY